jgi:hypothetical protein
MRLWNHAAHPLAIFIAKLLTKAGICLSAFWKKLADIHWNLELFAE